MKRNTFIVADEDAACREKIRTQLKIIAPEFQPIGEASTGKEAISLIKRLKPDIVFMDIDIPPTDGFSVIEACKDQKFVLIIITGSEHYALKAIKAGAADYLLKPARIQDLEAALQKSKEALLKNNSRNAKFSSAFSTQPKAERETRLPIRVGNFYELVDTEDIVFCRAHNNYTEITLNDNRKFLLSKTLKFYEERLKTHNFCRIHQSFLVNINFIKSVEKGRYSFLTLKDGTTLEIAQARKEGIFRLLGF